jgi:hypothetical protein
MVRYIYWYKPSENKVYRCDKDSEGNLYWRNVFPCHIGQWFTSSESPYPITELTTKIPFHAVDYYDAALKQNFQVVSTLPSSPQPDVFYFIPE